MSSKRQVKLILFIEFLSLFLSLSSSEMTKNENAQTEAINDAVNEQVKAALQIGNVSEVVVRNDLLLFPSNAPNLVLSHRQEIHAVKDPSNGTDDNDANGTNAKVSEVNEYTLSQIVKTNESDPKIVTTDGLSSGLTVVSSNTVSKNLSTAEPDKVVEKFTGFHPNGDIIKNNSTLPDIVQSLSIPNNAVADILKKSIVQTPPTSAQPVPIHLLRKKRLANSECDDDDDSSKDFSKASTERSVSSSNLDAEANTNDNHALRKRCKSSESQQSN